MEKPFDTVVRFARNSLEQTKKNIIFNFNQNDKILVWIVGFSITALTLIVTHITELNENYEEGLLKTVLLLLIISIIGGIFYRVSALLFLNKFQNQIFYLDGAFAKEKGMPSSTTDLSEESDIYAIQHIIASDYGFDYAHIIKQYESANETDKNILLKFLKDEYMRLSKWASKEYEVGEEFLKDVYKKAFGLSDRAINSYLNGKHDVLILKVYGWLCRLSMILCIISFIAVLVLLAANY